MKANYKSLSVASFGWLADKYIGTFKSLEAHLRRAGIRVLLKTWVSMMFLTTVLVFIGSLLTIMVMNVLFDFGAFFFLYLGLAPILAACGAFVIFYLYPMELESEKRNSIENNLPFAISHMSAVASSGIPPEYMFDLLTGFKEYGEISEQSRMVVRNIKTFGMSSLSAIKDAADRTPSKPFKEMLMGIASTIETGGNLIAYLNEMSERSLFEYRIKREKYLKTLSTYADIYTALLVAAPLMMLALLATMSVIGGQILGLSIQDIIVLMTWVALPLMNIGFLGFVHITYPGV